MITAETIGDYEALHMFVRVYCVGECRREMELDFKKLKAEYGEGARVSGLIARMRCSECGGRARFYQGFRGR